VAPNTLIIGRSGVPGASLVVNTSSRAMPYSAQPVIE
jgi:hypothetical protein